MPEMDRRSRPSTIGRCFGSDGQENCVQKGHGGCREAAQWLVRLLLSDRKVKTFSSVSFQSLPIVKRSQKRRRRPENCFEPPSSFSIIYFHLPNFPASGQVVFPFNPDTFNGKYAVGLSGEQRPARLPVVCADELDLPSAETVP